MSARGTDFFISHAGRDTAWAEWLAWQLQQAGYTVELDVWDWAPGEDFVAHMSAALERADRLLAVCTEAYFTAAFAGAELRAAFVRQVKADGRIVPVVVEPVTLPPLYAPLIPLDLTGLDEATAAARLRARLAGGRPTGPPPFPRGDPTPVSGDKPGFAGGLPGVWRVPPRNPRFTGRDGMLAELRARDRWLLIFDNAERPQQIADYQPGGAGHVLITSRSPGWGALGGRLEVDVLTRTETVALLQARIPALDGELADKLAAELGDLPLAAAQAAGYLEQTNLPAADYLRRFRTRRETLLARGDVVGYAGRIDTAWALSLERLRAEDPAAVQLLELAAFLAPAPIPLSLVNDHPGMLEEPLRATATDPDALADTVGALVGYSLARRSLDGFQVHRLVQAVIRHQLPRDRQQVAAERVVSLLAAASPGDPENPVSWAGYSRLAPHVLATAPLGDHSPAGRQLVLDTVHNLATRGSSASRAVSEQLLDRWRVILGPDHPDTLSAASALTLALTTMGELEPARALGKDTLHRCRRVLGPDHTTTLWAAATLTVALVSAGEVEPARALGEDTLPRCRRVLGLDHPTTLVAAATLTHVLVQLGETKLARTLGEDMLPRCLRVLGLDHPTTLLAATALTVALVSLGEVGPARALGEDTLQRCHQALGPDHTTTLVAAATLTVALVSAGETESAWALGEDTLQRCHRILGLDHPTTLWAATALAAALAQLGEAAAARALGVETLQRCQRVLRPDHTISLWAAATLTQALAQLGEAAAARALGVDTLQHCQRVLGSDHTTTLVAAAALTHALTSLGEAEAARALGVETLQRCQRVLGPDHTTTLVAAAALIHALTSLGEAEQARALSHDTLQYSRRVLGPNNPITRYLTQAASGRLPAQ